MKDEYSSVQWSASEALTKIGEPDIEPLIEALKDVDSYEAARESLKEIVGPAIKPLIKALGSEYAYVRWGQQGLLGIWKNQL